MKPFTGIWLFDHQRSPHGTQTNPILDRCAIVPAGEALQFHIRSQAEGQPPQRAHFSAIPDGQPRDLSGGRVLVCAVPTPSVLVTEIRQGPATLHVARREVAGNTMTVHESTPGQQPTVSVYHRCPIKQVIVYRRDLKMRKGKIAAQVAHAAMRVLLQRGDAAGDAMQIALTPAMSLWVQGRFTKVVLSVESEADLLKIHQTAKERGVPTALITDSGKTEFGGVPTRTTVAIGPATADEIDPITGRDGVVATKLA
ncbi:MAG: aminoacyl-tRNA hydrolase [Myxococcota bacterium]|nr:aminoacyl-tRNA hydrolase [Myxococcota bacterium]